MSGKYKCVKCGTVYGYKCRCDCGGWTERIEDNKQVHPIFRGILNNIERRVEG